MLDMKRILVPVDFSPPSRVALEQAIAIAEKYGASLDVLHVWDIPAYLSPHWALAVPEKSGRSFEEHVLALVRDETMDLIRLVRIPASVPLRTRFLRGDPARTIVAAARDGSYDLVVVGTHGRQGFDRVLLGSVAERVVRCAPCAVLVARGGARESVAVAQKAAS